MLRRKEPPARLADVLWDRTAAAITMKFSNTSSPRSSCTREESVE